MKKLSCFLTLMMLVLITQLSFGASAYVNLGTAPPPATLGPFTVAAFNTAPQAAIPDFTWVTSIPGDPRGGTLTSSIQLSKRTVPNGGWATWSHGYRGPVFSTRSNNSVTLTINPPANAFYLYVEPDAYNIFNCSAVTNTGLNSGNVPINGNAGATGFGFWDDTNPISTVTVTCDPAAGGFAVGEFGVNFVALQAPKLKLSPISPEFTEENHLDFGEVLVGTQKGPAIVKIENQGSQTVFISGIVIEEYTMQASQTNYILDLNAGDYPCRTTQFNLGPGNYCTVGIIFAPQSQGRKDAFLSVYPNSPYPEKLYMTGVGVAQSGGGGGGCSMSAGASPVNVLAWVLLPTLMILRRLKRS